MTTSSSDLREEESENSSASPTIVVESEESFADDLADLDSDVEDEEEPSNETKPADDVQPDQLMISIAKGFLVEIAVESETEPLFRYEKRI